MAKVSLYDTASREVGPVEDLLMAVVAVNWHLMAAQDRGWSIVLTVDGATGQLGVNVLRGDCWPSASSEAEAEDIPRPVIP